MALDNVLGNLTVKIKGRREVNPTYNPENFYDSARGLEEIGDIDVSTEEGLKKYKKMTGDKISNMSSDEVELRKKAMHSGGHSDLSNYIHQHFSSLVREIDDEDVQAELSIRYCPIGNSNDKEYNAVRKRVSESNATLKRISENPKKFLEEALKESSDLMAYYMQIFSREYFGLKQREAQRNANLAVRHYGPTRFLIATKTYLDDQNEKLEKESKRIEESIIRKVETAEVDKGRILFANEKSKLVGDKIKKLHELVNKHKDAQMRDEFMGTCASYAVNSLKKKYESPKPKQSGSKKSKSTKKKKK